jgi:hypothetical protein
MERASQLQPQPISAYQRTCLKHTGIQVQYYGPVCYVCELEHLFEERGLKLAKAKQALLGVREGYGQVDVLLQTFREKLHLDEEDYY